MANRNLEDQLKLWEKKDSLIIVSENRKYLGKKRIIIKHFSVNKIT